MCIRDSQWIDVTRLRTELDAAVQESGNIPRVEPDTLDAAIQDAARLHASFKKTEQTYQDYTAGRYIDLLPYCPKVEGRPAGDVIFQQLNAAKSALAVVRASRPEIPAQLHEDRATAKGLLAHAAIYERGECPTCGQKVDPAKSAQMRAEAASLINGADAATKGINDGHTLAVSTAEAKVAELDGWFRNAVEQLGKAIYDSLSVRKASFEAADTGARTLTTAANARKEVDQKVTTLRNRLGELPSEEMDTAELGRLKEIGANLDRAPAAAQSALRALNQASQSRDDAEKRVIAAQTRLQQAREALPDAPSTQELEQVKIDLKILSERRQSLDELELQRRVVDAQLSQLEASKTVLQTQVGLQSRNAKWVALVNKMREVTHASAFPALAMRVYVSYINARLAHYLAMWEAPFDLWLTNDMTFRMRKADGPEADAARLSGGERVVAALTFRLTMSDLFSKGVGFLVLDEPSAYLDTENIQHLQHVMLRLKAVTGSSGKQVLVITHEQSLMGFFDSMVQIGEIQTAET